MQMPFGKYRGRDLRDVPDDYLLWVLDNCGRISPHLRRAIEARLEAGDPGPPPTAGRPSAPGPSLPAALVDRWYRELAMRWHPDRGGTVEAMQAVNDARDSLCRLLSGV